MEEKLFGYIDDIADSYGESIEIIPGLTFDQKDTLRTVEFYSNNKYLSGNRDSLGREKPFYNVCNYRVMVAKTATDLDVKDIRFEPDSLKFAIQTMLINRELFKYLKESNFSQFLNDEGQTEPKYGGALVKRTDGKDGMRIEVVNWANVETDPSDILGGAIIETHYLLPSEFYDKRDVWKNVSEVMKAHQKFNRNKPRKVEVKEITGTLPEYFDPDYEGTEADAGYKTMCLYVACVNKKKFYLYKEDLKSINDKYKYKAWDKVPKRSLGRGVVEEGFESQWATNDSMLSMKNAMELSGKVVLSTTSKKVGGNIITGVDNGHIFEIEPNTKIESLNLSATALPQFERTIELWNQQYDRVASTYDANTGEAPTAGTPYSQTALLNQVANSPFEYRREERGIFVNEILNDWILPHLKKRIRKEHYLVSEYTDDELEMIDEAVANYNANRIVMGKVLDEGQLVYPEEYQGIKEGIKKALGSDGKKREIRIPDGFLDVEGSITANITGELKNKQAVLQSLAQIGKDVMATYNPNTGTYAALENPFLRQLYGQIIEQSGVSMSSASLKPSPSQPPVDLSAVTPMPNVTAPAAV